MCVLICVCNQTETQADLSAGFSLPLSLAAFQAEASTPPRSCRGGDRPAGEGGVVLASSLGLAGV